MLLKRSAARSTNMEKEEVVEDMIMITTMMKKKNLKITVTNILIVLLKAQVLKTRRNNRVKTL